MYKLKKKPKDEPPTLVYLRKKREEKWEQIQKNIKAGGYSTISQKQGRLKKS